MDFVIGLIVGVLATLVVATCGRFWRASERAVGRQEARLRQMEAEFRPRVVFGKHNDGG